MAQYFGTDGVRGIANRELNSELAFKLGQAAVIVLGQSIVIGKDTRTSGDMLESALAAGIMSLGGRALKAGIIPTPGVALLVRTTKAQGGIVISASHNPPEYNGIKFFDSQGFKLTTATENKIESLLEESLDSPTISTDLPIGSAVGREEVLSDAREIYQNHAIESVLSKGIDFKGLHIALDTGHGAASLTSKSTFEALGAKVSAINNDCCGCGINVKCGSTHLEPLRNLLKETKADIGIAHDGDADRVILMRPDGFVLDGDFIEALLAIDLLKQGKLAHKSVCSTIMCNLGFIKAMQENGIEVVQTQVGDRFVLDEMRRRGYVLGGEQSGHMIMLDYNTTGDGLITACQYLSAIIQSGQSIVDATSVMRRYPQVLINVSVSDKEAFHENPAIGQAVKQIESELKDNGRVVIRPSGTEPLIRVMVEASDEESAQRYAKQLACVVEEQLS